MTRSQITRLIRTLRVECIPAVKAERPELVPTMHANLERLERWLKQQEESLPCGSTNTN